MEDSSESFEYIFRIYSNEESCNIKIRQYLADEIHKEKRSPNFTVFSIILHDGSILRKLKHLKTSCPSIEFDIFISLVPLLGSEIKKVPRYVRDIISEFSLEIYLSYTIAY